MTLEEGIEEDASVSHWPLCTLRHRLAKIHQVVGAGRRETKSDKLASRYDRGPEESGLKEKDFFTLPSEAGSFIWGMRHNRIPWRSEHVAEVADHLTAAMEETGRQLGARDRTRSFHHSFPKEGSLGVALLA